MRGQGFNLKLGALEGTAHALLPALFELLQRLGEVESQVVMTLDSLTP